MVVFRFRALCTALMACVALLVLVTSFGTRFAHAGVYALVLPDEAVVDDPKTRSIQLTLALVDPFAAKGMALERPQAFTALRYAGENLERSEHLSVLEESTAFGAPAWQTEVALPHPGVYQFLLATKPIWMPDEERFIQFSSRVQVPAFGSQEGWDKPLGEALEIVPQARPFGLCTGMQFAGQVLANGKPLPDAVIRVAHLKSEKVPQNQRRVAASPWQEEQLVRADANGRFSFSCPLSGWWGFAVGVTGDPLQGPDGQLKPLENRAVIWVNMDPCKERFAK